MQTIYRPGQWHLIVIPGALVALPPDIPGDVVSRLWERLPETRTLATVVDVLTSHAGGSFSALPPFAAAVVEGADLRIALRGRVVARVGASEGETEFSGAEVTTWSERFVAGAIKVEITVEETGSGSVLPVQSGLVLAAAVSAELEEGDARTPAVSPGPTPVVVSSALGASAAALTGEPAPLLAAFPVPASGTALGAGADAAPDAGAASDEANGTSASEDVRSAPVDEAPATPESAPSPEETPAPEGVVSAAASAEPSALDEAEDHVEPVNGATLLPPEMTLAPSPEEDDFDQLWGATVHSAPAAPPAPPMPPVAVPAPAGDHDGATISAAELRALRQQAPATADETPTAVLPIADIEASAGRIRVSTGQVVALDRTVIIGRRPRSTRASGANLPHLVAVESPQQDISRSHLEIRPEGDTVVVIDLHTTNGSTLLRPGADPVRLHPGEQTLVLSGDVVDLGDGVTVAFEDLP